MGPAQRAHFKKKEELEAALDEARTNGTTSHTLIGDVWRAQRINRVVGFGMLRPWEIQELDEEWLQVFDGLFELQELREQQKAQTRAAEDAFARVRARHPSYRKYG